MNTIMIDLNDPTITIGTSTALTRSREACDRLADAVRTHDHAALAAVYRTVVPLVPPRSTPMARKIRRMLRTIP